MNYHKKIKNRICLSLFVFVWAGFTTHAQNQDTVQYSYSEEARQANEKDLSRFENMNHQVMQKKGIVKAGFAPFDFSLLYVSYERKLSGRFSIQLETANRLFSYGDQETLNKLDLGALVGTGLNEGLDNLRNGFNQIHSEFMEYKAQSSHFTNLSVRYYYSARSKVTGAPIGSYIALALTDLFTGPVEEEDSWTASFQPGVYWGVQFPMVTRLLLDMRIGFVPSSFAEDSLTGRSNFDTRIILTYLL